VRGVEAFAWKVEGLGVRFPIATSPCPTIIVMMSHVYNYGPHDHMPSKTSKFGQGWPRIKIIIIAI
jgi:hypothetical protein